MIVFICLYLSFIVFNVNNLREGHAIVWVHLIALEVMDKAGDLFFSP